MNVLPQRGLGALEMLLKLEEQLSLEISDEQAGEMSTVGDILDFVTHRGG